MNKIKTAHRLVLAIYTTATLATACSPDTLSTCTMSQLWDMGKAKTAQTATVVYNTAKPVVVKASIQLSDSAFSKGTQAKVAVVASIHTATEVK